MQVMHTPSFAHKGQLTCNFGTHTMLQFIWGRRAVYNFDQTQWWNFRIHIIFLILLLLSECKVLVLLKVACTCIFPSAAGPQISGCPAFHSLEGPPLSSRNHSECIPALLISITTTFVESSSISLSVFRVRTRSVHQFIDIFGCCLYL